MGLFTRRCGTVFLKEESASSEFIDRMRESQERADRETARKIESQIRMASYGRAGEENIAFELKNSGMDMYVLHDIYMETDDLSAQIDYIVITRQHVYVIECKNLIGNIEIDNTGAFIRSYGFGGRTIKEGIYSPITQNERHLKVMKEIRKASRWGFLSKMKFEKEFDRTYRSIVVLANPKTYLNARFAPKEIRQQVIRADQLISYLRQNDEQEEEQGMSSRQMLELAEFYLAQDEPERSDYAKKYDLMVERCGLKKTEQWGTWEQTDDTDEDK